VFKAELFVGTPGDFLGPPGGFSKIEGETWEGILLRLGVLPEKQKEIEGVFVPCSPEGLNKLGLIPPMVWVISAI
jgi:hypothetical protein